MSVTMDDSIKRWTAKRKTALVVEIIQGKTPVAEANRAGERSTGPFPSGPLVPCPGPPPSARPAGRKSCPPPQDAAEGANAPMRTPGVIHGALGPVRGAAPPSLYGAARRRKYDVISAGYDGG